MLKKRDVYTPGPAAIWKRIYFDLRTDVSDGFSLVLRGNKILLLVVRIELPETENFPEAASPQRNEALPNGRINNGYITSYLVSPGLGRYLPRSCGGRTLIAEQTAA